VLRDQYAKLDLLRSQADIDPNSSAQLLPYGAALVQELHRRNEDPWMMQQSVSQIENPQREQSQVQMRVEGGYKDKVFCQNSRLRFSNRSKNFTIQVFRCTIFQSDS
jgi:hypothetical protein